MFAGIIEAIEPIEIIQIGENFIRIAIRRPPSFDDLKNGDSIAVNGMCLTVEGFDEKQMQFTIGAESLRILKTGIGDVASTPTKWASQPANLERSLHYGDRVHGHFVTGHVDARGQVVRTVREGPCLFLDVEISNDLKPFVWTKSCVALNGVSLTVNEAKLSEVNLSNSPVRISVCLIPETIERTNLASLTAGENLNVEVDWMAKALIKSWALREPEKSLSK